VSACLLSELGGEEGEDSGGSGHQSFASIGSWCYGDFGKGGSNSDARIVVHVIC